MKKLVKDGTVSLLDFCDWVGEGKFRHGEDIRKLPLILKDDTAKQAFIEDDFQAGLDQLEQKNPAAKSKLFETSGGVEKAGGRLNNYFNPSIRPDQESK
ncbi:MAG: hypothetical protein RQ824_01785 [bacterium]|nr:hypothetical protein [bacterium]